jgi:hypothetical protein
MTIAHIGGLPFEELLGPFILTSGSVAIAIRDALRRHSRLRAPKAPSR